MGEVKTRIAELREPHLRLEASTAGARFMPWPCIRSLPGLDSKCGGRCPAHRRRRDQRQHPLRIPLGGTGVLHRELRRRSGGHYAPAVGGVIAASTFGGSLSAAPGSFIEIYGADLANTTRQWSTADFDGLRAPTSLDGVTVTVGGQSAFVCYVRPSRNSRQSLFSGAPQ